ncbi:tyrosine-type recombinase/integrase [Tepidibacter formicigenes]|jgi:site-specific recombinase XerD|uniref:Phage integrase, N-terminal SAM-like domain n=1 Tax=Tepidibacter formicigenes DSM 15518 TaxID=1123349 RepID=A0A1M6UCR3_9FIRM|nr:tyrosine-type recombinase/integrase [Tepidibacter formicigenes]SHK66967.1 Phage integrase, N-terminal SAM-like domain [Tepidibacter formicigenes DSM 15518]
MLKSFEKFLRNEDKSENTIKSYINHMKLYLNWFEDSFGSEFKKLYRENILDYKSFLKNIKKDSARTINAKIAALIKFNEFLIEQDIQNNVVVSKKDNIKIQSQGASPTDINKTDVEKFRQTVLEKGSKRDYAIITLLAYSGLRISEALNLKLDDVSLVAKEILIRSGKGDKQRIVYINDKIINAIKSYINERNSDSSYLFVSRQSDKLNRTRVNQIFNKFSDKITPHKLRHFWCTHALENGYSVHEVANQAGHSNIHTTLIYTNPSKEKMKEKANLL